ncbi:MAG: primosomal protein N', partial [Acidithiobacillus sp.]
ATERLAQTVLQVAGRAGRGDEPGRVLLQSHVPEHPLLALLQAGDYSAIAQHLLEERRSAQLPPFRALALLRAEAHRPERVQAFLEAVAGQAPAELEISGPFPSLLERRAGFHRAELWLEAADRTQLQRALKHWLREVGKQPEGRRVRWVVDVDPLNF